MTRDKVTRDRTIGKGTWKIENGSGSRDFPHKSCLLAMGQHYIGNVLVQCWSREILTKFEIILPCTVVCGLWTNIAQVTFLCSVILEAPDNIAQEISCSMLPGYSWGNIALFKTLSNAVQKAPDNIVQENDWVQHCLNNTWSLFGNFFFNWLIFW